MEAAVLCVIMYCHFNEGTLSIGPTSYVHLLNIQSKYVLPLYLYTLYHF